MIKGACTAGERGTDQYLPKGRVLRPKQAPGQPRCHGSASQFNWSSKDINKLVSIQIKRAHDDMAGLVCTLIKVHTLKILKKVSRKQGKRWKHQRMQRNVIHLFFFSEVALTLPLFACVSVQGYTATVFRLHSP